MSADEFDARLAAGEPVEIRADFKSHVPLFTFSVSHVVAAAAGSQRTANVQTVKPRFLTTA